MQIEIESFTSQNLAIELVSDKVYSVPGWEPAPLMRFFNRIRDDDTQILIAASIGCLQWTLKSRDDLDHFMNRCIPTFCESIIPIKQLSYNYGKSQSRRSSARKQTHE